MGGMSDGLMGGMEKVGFLDNLLPAPWPIIIRIAGWALMVIVAIWLLGLIIGKFIAKAKYSEKRSMYSVWERILYVVLGIAAIAVIIGVAAYCVMNGII